MNNHINCQKSAQFAKKIKPTATSDSFNTLILSGCSDRYELSYYYQKVISNHDTFENSRCMLHIHIQ